MDAVVLLQYILKASPRNCGPPSERIDLGRLKYSNHFLMAQVTVRKVVMVRRAMHPWIAGVSIYHHQVVVAALRKQVHAHRLLSSPASSKAAGQLSSS